MKKIAVIGACCSRDVFNSKFVEDWRQQFDLIYYSFQTSIISMMSAPIPYSQRLLNHKGENYSEWYKNIFERELDKSFLTDLHSLSPDNLLIDFYSDIVNGVLEIEEGKSYLSQRKKDQVNNAVFHTLIITKELTPTADLKTYMELWQPAMECFWEWTRKNIPDTEIIINRPYFVNRIKYSDGHVGKYQNENCGLYNDIYERMISFVKRLAPDVKILDMGDNYYIDPDYIFGGAWIVHYEKKYYKDLCSTLFEICVSSKEINNALAVNQMRKGTTMKNISEIFVDKCYGCGACENICPKSAIKMRDIIGEGYLYPAIDSTACINCGKCVSVCPSANKVDNKSINPTAYVIKTERNIAEGSSSAGFFKVLASYVLAQGGFVCGAIFDESFNVHHVITDNEMVVEKMRRSKYVQSNVKDCYKKVKDILDKGYMVLFSGTPCQIAGLYLYLGKKYEKLITMGLICHGVPSPGMWQKYLSEDFDIKDIEDINFRYRGNDSFWGSQYLKVSYRDGHEDIWNNRENTFYTYFLEDIGLRQACYDCAYHVIPYPCDFMVGDFWGAAKIRNEWIDENKMSVVLVNCISASIVFERIKYRFLMCREIKTDEALTSNVRSIKRSMPKNRKVFYDLINKGYGFSEALKRTIYPQKYDVLIFGPTFVFNNFGAMATYYSLNKYLTKEGYKTVLYGRDDFMKREDDRSLFLRSNMKYLALSSDRYAQYNWVADSILLGSDQVWNYPLFQSFKNRLYLDFADDYIRKIAYGSSFGFDYLRVYEGYTDQYPVLNRLMKRFDHISVREEEGVTLCNTEYNVDAEHVLDPVFLLDEKDYSKIADNARNQILGKYVLSYVIRFPDNDFNILAETTREKKKLPLYAMVTGMGEDFELQKSRSVGTVYENLSMEEWINNIRKAEFIITDSFHCICFSIIFRKNFIIFNKNWGVSRIRSLLSSAGLSDRHISSIDEIEDKEYLFYEGIDYDAVWEKLAVLRSKSAAWLKNALNGVKRSFVTYKVDGDVICDLEIQKARNLYEYTQIVRKNDDYIIAICANGIGNIYEISHFLLDVSGVKKITESYDGDALYYQSEPLQIFGLNRTNQRYTDIRMSTELVRELTGNPHSVYSVSFDWNTDAASGEFKIQLGSKPWDSLTGVITVTLDKQSGHYENIWLSSSGISSFESDNLQVRLDNIEGPLIIKNFKIQRGNRVTDPELNLNGFAMISDLKGYNNVSTTSMGRIVYTFESESLIIEYQNEGFRELKPNTEFYVENNEYRYIYPCEKKGFYYFLYSKKQHKVVDISYSSFDCKGLPIKHLS